MTKLWKKSLKSVKKWQIIVKKNCTKREASKKKLQTCEKKTQTCEKSEKKRKKKWQISEKM